MAMCCGLPDGATGAGVGVLLAVGAGVGAAGALAALRSAASCAARGAPGALAPPPAPASRAAGAEPDAAAKACAFACRASKSVSDLPSPTSVAGAGWRLSDDWAVAAPGHRATPPAAAPAARTVEHATVIVSLDGGRTRECLPCEVKMCLWSSAPGADCHPGRCRPAMFRGVMRQ